MWLVLCRRLDYLPAIGAVSSQIASREDPPEYNAALTINKHMISGELDNRQGY
jgi:hypothetical protein